MRGITEICTDGYTKRSTKEDSPSYTPDGYLGKIDGRYILFATEDEYYEYLEERE